MVEGKLFVEVEGALEGKVSVDMLGKSKVSIMVNEEVVRLGVPVYVLSTNNDIIKVAGKVEILVEGNVEVLGEVLVRVSGELEGANKVEVEVERSKGHRFVFCLDRH